MNLYIHIPFCASKCSYCHFYSVISPNLIFTFSQCLKTELKLRIPPKTVITSLYFGGGTPSLLPPPYLKSIIDKLTLSPQAEITLECHPKTLSKNMIKAYIDIGINRLSIGIQSWNHKILKSMGRKYSIAQVKDVLLYAQSLGLTNINFDHIIAYPYQTDQILLKDINVSLSLNPTHISIYPLERHLRTKIYKSPPVAKIMRQFALVQKLLVNTGFIHYEELNFAKSNFYCKHNLDFWSGEDYIGFGPSAVSKEGNIILENLPGITDYINFLKLNHLPPSLKTPLSSHHLKILNQELSNRLLISSALN